MATRWDLETLRRDITNRLQEKGRVVSAKNEQALRSAVAALAAVLATLDPEPEAEAESAGPILTVAAEAIAQADLSYSEQERLVRAAAKARYPGPGIYVWPEAVYEDRVIVRVEAESTGQSVCYSHPWSIAAGVVTLGDGSVVQQVTRWEPVADPTNPAEAALYLSDAVQLREALGLRAGQTVPIKIISPGWGSSGYYPAEVLKRDGPGIFTTGLHCYWDHPSFSEQADRPEDSLRNLAGVLSEDAKWVDKGADGPGLYARVEVFAPYQEAVEELAPHIGMSIRALGESELGEREGRAGRIITELTAARSVDFVTMAGRGGAIVGLFEAARGGRPTTPPTPGGDEMTPEQQQALEESNRRLTEQVTTQNQQISQLLRQGLVSDARGLVLEALGKSELPVPARERLARALEFNPPAKDGALDRDALSAQVAEAIKTELAYIESVGGKKGAATAPSPVVGMGSTTEPVSEAAAPATEDQVRMWEGFGLTPEQAKIAALGRVNG